MKIYAPNIHLFAFALYKGANINSTSVQADKIQLWQSADEIVRTTLHQNLHLSQRIDIHKEPESLRVDLLKDSEVKNDNYAVDTAISLKIYSFAAKFRRLSKYNRHKRV